MNFWLCDHGLAENNFPNVIEDNRGWDESNLPIKIDLILKAHEKFCSIHGLWQRRLCSTLNHRKQTIANQKKASTFRDIMFVA